jgi:hypothetical protein
MIGNRFIGDPAEYLAEVFTAQLPQLPANRCGDIMLGGALAATLHSGQQSFGPCRLADVLHPDR